MNSQKSQINFPIVLSRKLRHSIESNLFSLYEGKFTEKNIKELLIDLREYIKCVNKKIDFKENVKFNNAIKRSIDLCDFIAHTNRDRGDFKDFILKVEKQISKTRDVNLNYCDIIEPDGIVASLGVFAGLFMSEFDSTFKLDVEKLYKFKNEISLCFASLLQDTLIFLDAEIRSHSASLFLRSHEGFYRLYCVIKNPILEQEARKNGAQGDGKIFVSFPVIETRIQNIDGLNLNKDLNKILSIIETYRDEKNILKLRII